MTEQKPKWLDNLPDWLRRSIKTFIQAFLAYIAINWGMVHARLVNWDFSDWKSWVLPLIGGGISAGICAIWNGTKEISEAKKEGKEQ